MVIAVDGKQGVETAAAELPDLILMDMSLPEMDGWEATRILKSDSATKSIPIMGLTAHAMAGDREKCLEAGCDEYGSKSVDFSELVDKIQQLTGGQLS